MRERQEFVRLALQDGANRRELCRRFGVSPQTGYKWLERWSGGDRGLADRSHRPHSSPGQSASQLEAKIVAARDAHPAWGARKIATCLDREGHKGSSAPNSATTGCADSVTGGKNH